MKNQITKHNLTAEQIAAIQWYYQEVCGRAEKNMRFSLKLEGAHYAAMNSIIKELLEDASDT